MNLRILLLLITFLVPQLGRAAVSALPTIDLIEISTLSASLPHSYSPGGSFLLLVEEVADVHLSGGEIGMFGAGGSSGSTTTFASTNVSGGQLEFNLNPISGGKFYERVSFSAPLPFVRTGFRLDLQGPVVLTAQTGSYDAVLSGNLLVARNGFSSPFTGTEAALLGAEQGESIPFSVTYTRLGTPWSATSFQSAFDYTLRADLNTAAVPASVPEGGPGLLAGLALLGICYAGRRKKAGR